VRLAHYATSSRSEHVPHSAPRGNSEAFQVSCKVKYVLAQQRMQIHFLPRARRDSATPQMRTESWNRYLRSACNPRSMRTLFRRHVPCSAHPYCRNRQSATQAHRRSRTYRRRTYHLPRAGMVELPCCPQNHSRPQSAGKPEDRSHRDPILRLPRPRWQEPRRAHYFLSRHADHWPAEDLRLSSRILESKMGAARSLPSTGIACP
jgi:hypothetical protein